VILDTNALSAWAKDENELLAVLPPEPQIMLPAIVVGEYRYGVLRSSHRDTLESWLNRTLASVRIGIINLATSDAYAIVRLMLQRKGQPIPANDTWIAALALQHNLPVLSRDTHFDEVDGITRVGW
jgi:predicted nucleic acid-binding protein